MESVIKELHKCLRYNKRQLEENLHSIAHKQEAIELLERANEDIITAIDEIEKALEILKADQSAI